MYDDFEQTKASNAKKELEKKEDSEAKGATAREAAMVSLGKRKAKSGEECFHKEDKHNKYSGMVPMVAEDTDKELAYKREELQFCQKQFVASEKGQEFRHLQF